ncbi:hypothetical protein KQX54_010268 [Cotesia glomerata]|uniref:Uncharacterized protein n=1 Tax=Cotesia glomerata TaxID=32391 RepID=A0AAV7IHH2_COTGL|nr:hypothetical protein KQX54_010268 [Cotesia glomerata]
MSCDKNTEATPVCSKDNCQCQGALVGANLCHGALHAYSELQTLGTLRAHSTLMSLKDFSGSVPCESNVKNNVSENVKENVSENVSNKVLHVQPEFKSLRDRVSGVRCELVLENTLEDCQAISEKRNSDSSNDNDSTRKRTKSNYYEIRKILLILISADCTFIPKSSRELLNQGKFSIENLLENPGNLGEVIATRWNQNYILHLIVQNTKNERPKIDTVENCISALKIVMEQLGIKTASLSKGILIDFRVRGGRSKDGCLQKGISSFPNMRELGNFSLKDNRACCLVRKDMPMIPFCSIGKLLSTIWKLISIFRIFKVISP